MEKALADLKVRHAQSIQKVTDAEKKLAEARKSGDPAKITKAEQDLEKAREAQAKIAGDIPLKEKDIAKQREAVKVATDKAKIAADDYKESLAQEQQCRLFR